MADVKDDLKTDEIEIEVLEGPNELDNTTEVKVDEKQADKSSTDPGAGVEALKQQLAASQAAHAREAAARRQADERAAQSTQTVDQTRAEAVKAYELSAKQSLDSGEAALKAAKAKFKTSMEAANFDEAGDAQAEIANATNQINAAKYQITQIDGVKRQMADAATMVSKQRDAGAGRQSRDDTQTVVDNIPSRSKEWIAKNPQFNSDQAFHNKAMAAHYRALADGVEMESEKYFEILDKAVNPAREVEVTKEAAKPVAGATGASPSRGAQSGKAAGEGPTRIRLTPAQMEAAELSGMKPVDYAKHLIQLQNEGKIARTN